MQGCLQNEEPGIVTDQTEKSACTSDRRWLASWFQRPQASVDSRTPRTDLRLQQYEENTVERTASDMTPYPLAAA